MILMFSCPLLCGQCGGDSGVVGVPTCAYEGKEECFITTPWLATFPTPGSMG
jgi:hypothetical protein